MDWSKALLRYLVMLPVLASGCDLGGPKIPVGNQGEDSGTDVAAPTCQSSADCIAGYTCQGPQGCSVAWTCQPPVACTTIATSYCTCDGQTINAGGCSPVPYAHEGACEDAGSPDTGGDASPGACSGAGSVSFQMQAAAASQTVYHYVQSFGDPGDGVWWYSVAKADGTPVYIHWPAATEAVDCSTCSGIAEPIGVACGAVLQAGATACWDGTAVAANTCAGASGQVSCGQREVVPAGSYIATLCAYTDADCSGGSHQGQASGTTCVTVPFQYPATAPVVGVLP